MDLTLASPNHRSAPVSHRRSIRRQPVLVFTVAVLLVAVIGVVGGWITHSRAGNTLNNLIADFESNGFPPAEEVPFDSSSTHEYKDYQLPVLRELGLMRGVRWRANHQQTHQELEVRVYQFQEPAQAIDAQRRLSICFNLKTEPFPTPGIAASQGRQCTLKGQRVQEVSFTRDTRLYKLKLSPGSRTEEMILELSRAEAAVAR